MGSNSNVELVRRFMKNMTEEKLDKLPETKKRQMLIRMNRVLEDIGKNKLPTYNATKIHKKQMIFHKSKKRKRLLLGGNRTGKTVGGAVETVWWARGNHPYRKIKRATEGWVVSVTNEVQRDVAQKEILQWLNPDWIIDIGVRAGSKSDIDNAILDYILVRSERGGVSKIGFKSCEQGRKKFQGTSKDYIWFDEEPDEDIYDECQMRIMDVEGSIWLTMTPLMGLTFIYDRLFLNERNDPEVLCIKMSWEDNPYLPLREIEAMIANLTPEQQESRRHGNFVAMTGLVYSEFNPDYHILKGEYDFNQKIIYLIDDKGVRYSQIYRRWYDRISIDPGYTAPTSIHFYAEDDEGNVYCVAEQYESYKLVPYHSKVIKDIANALVWPKVNGGYTGIIDTAANAKSAATDESVKEQYTKHKIYLRDVDKSVWDGIISVKNYLQLHPYADKKAFPKGKPKFFIVQVENWPYDTVEIRKEIKKYRWKAQVVGQSTKEAPIKRDDHAMDDLRYHLHEKPKTKIFMTHSESYAEKHSLMSDLERADNGFSSSQDTGQPFKAGRIENENEDNTHQRTSNGTKLFDRLGSKGSNQDTSVNINSRGSNSPYSANQRNTRYGKKG